MWAAEQRDAAPVPEAFASVAATGFGEAGPARERDSLGEVGQGRRPKRRRGLEGLEIGAPLTAAFIGVMLADKVAFAGTGEQSPEPGAGVPPEPDGADRTIVERETSLAVQSKASEQGKLDGEPTTGDVSDAAFIDAGPVTLTESDLDPLPVGGGTTVQAAPRPGQPPAPETSAGSTDVSLTMSTMSLALPGDEAVATTDGTAEPDPLGTFDTGTGADDILDGTDNADRIGGGAGNDVIRGGAGQDVLDGTDGDDQLFGEGDRDHLRGGAGDDLLDGGPGNDILEGGAGNDRPLGGDGRDTLRGGEGDDILDGGAFGDVMEGGPGDDILVIESLGDIAYGGSIAFDDGGIDTVQVAPGLSEGEPMTFAFTDGEFRNLPEGVAQASLTLVHDIENLTLTGDTGHDALGNRLDNAITGNAGDNVLIGMEGDDILARALGDDVLDGGAGDDILDGADGFDRLVGGAGNDELLGGAGDDDLAGGAGADASLGGSGDDTLSGGAGGDILYGGDGDDTLAGGEGVDMLYGGAGGDVYYLGVSDVGVDTIFDHEGVNSLVLEQSPPTYGWVAEIRGDLHVIIGGTKLHTIAGYAHAPEAWSTIDFGDGPLEIADIVVRFGSAEPLAGIDAPTPGAGDLLGSDLLAPTIAGTDAADTLTGLAGGDWLAGLGGDDRLAGGGGDDILAGGDGSDRLAGGAGDDLYAFEAGEAGVDRISDPEGTNSAALYGFDGRDLHASLIDSDLWVAADFEPIFMVEDFAGNESAFAGVHIGDRFVRSEEMIA